MKRATHILAPITLVLGLALAGGVRADATTDRALSLTDLDRDGTITTEEYRHRMVEIFFFLDENGDGVLVIQELADARPDAFEQADRNNNETLEMQEFLQHAARVFRDMDDNTDGFLTRDELPR